MSLFNWFSRKPAPILPPRGAQPSRPQSHAPARVSSRRKSAGDAASPAQPQGASAAEQRKTERLQRRELLYQVVRDTMPRAGLLSSAYKFKVLSLDQRGRQFMVMVDLQSDQALPSDQWAALEAMIVHSAKRRTDIDVTAVYWRLDDGSARHAPAREERDQTHPMPLQAPRVVPHHDPLDEAEVAAFKRALAAGLAAPAPAPASASNYTLLTGYEDTEVVETDDPTPALSGTQYGELR